MCVKMVRFVSFCLHCCESAGESMFQEMLEYRIKFAVRRNYS